LIPKRHEVEATSAANTLHNICVKSWPLASAVNLQKKRRKARVQRQVNIKQRFEKETREGLQWTVKSVGVCTKKQINRNWSNKNPIKLKRGNRNRSSEREEREGIFINPNLEDHFLICFTVLYHSLGRKESWRLDWSSELRRMPSVENKSSRFRDNNRIFCISTWIREILDFIGPCLRFPDHRRNVCKITSEN
jgi:hypothetical protein